MESEFNTASRGKKHKVPKKELDLTGMQKWLGDSKATKTIRARKMGSKVDQPKNYPGMGQLNLQLKKRMQRWVENRNFPRATSENWAEYSDSSDEDD
jgi:hypothetical protein